MKYQLEERTHVDIKNVASAYVASPYSHRDLGLMHRRYKQVGAFIAAATRVEDNRTFWYSPICHYHDLAWTHEIPTDAMTWQMVNYKALAVCEITALLVLPGWHKSFGVMTELEWTAKLGNSGRYTHIEVYAPEQEMPSSLQAYPKAIPHVPGYVGVQVPVSDLIHTAQKIRSEDQLA